MVETETETSRDTAVGANKYSMWEKFAGLDFSTEFVQILIGTHSCKYFVVTHSCKYLLAPNCTVRTRTFEVGGVKHRSPRLSLAAIPHKLIYDILPLRLVLTSCRPFFRRFPASGDTVDRVDHGKYGHGITRRRVNQRAAWNECYCQCDAMQMEMTKVDM